MRFGRALADAVTRYAAELEKLAATTCTAAVGTDEPAGRAA